MNRYGWKTLKPVSILKPYRTAPASIFGLHKGKIQSKDDLIAPLDMAIRPALQTGLLEIPLQGTTAIRAGQLQSFHGDPVDRMIVTTDKQKESQADFHHKSARFHRY